MARPYLLWLYPTCYGSALLVRQYALWQVFLTMHRGDALERGAELGVFFIDAPQVHFSVHEGQLHLLAKLLEYSFNYSRFLPNWYVSKCSM